MLLLTVGMMACNVFGQTKPPASIGPVPSQRQMLWHPLEYYAFVHFNMNTFTNMEWGTGSESPDQFHPLQLDTRQWARIAKEAGMKGIILTAKHHDGFCLWPTATTAHSVKNSAWRNGEGDVLRDLSEACREYGLKFGVYLSPWDRNNQDYGSPAYVEVFHTQLREILNNYGDVFEVWFDGANGGSGYYGGANETRKIDSRTYYEWDKVTEIVREMQPDAVIFSDGGPDIRWVGNEDGMANETNWAVMRRAEIYPGWPRYVELRSGHPDGTHWLPAEADVSIRPGWYYHPAEDHQVKSLPALLDIYYGSVGRNASLLLNLPVDQRGLIHEKDAQQLMVLKAQLDRDFAVDLARDSEVTASQVRGNSREYTAANVNDGNPATFWAPEDTTVTASLTLTFPTALEMNRLLLQEYIPLGQRVQEFSIEVKATGHWKEIDRQTTIGNKRILRFDPVTTRQLRINILKAKGAPLLSNIGVFRAPNVLSEPAIRRSRQGLVSIEVPDKQLNIYYKVGEAADENSWQAYDACFRAEGPTVVRAMAVDPQGPDSTAVVKRYFDIFKKDWKVLKVSSGELEEGYKMLDDDPGTFWASHEGIGLPQEITIDLGKVERIRGFSYWPMQERWSYGIITEYELLGSNDNKNWQILSSGEFANIGNHPVEQFKSVTPVPVRFLTLKALKVHGEIARVSIGEFGILTTKD